MSPYPNWGKNFKPWTKPDVRLSRQGVYCVSPFCNHALSDLHGALDACVMVTVPANKLIATLPTDRMPAVLADDEYWATWLGESGMPEDAKKCLKTVEGVRWTMTKEEKAATGTRKRPTVSDPGGLL